MRIFSQLCCKLCKVPQDVGNRKVSADTFSKTLSKCLDLIFFSVSKLTANYTFCTNWESRMATGWCVCYDGDLVTACDDTSLRIRHRCFVQPPLDCSLRSHGLCCLLILSLLSNSALGYLGLYYLQFQGEILFVNCFQSSSTSSFMSVVTSPPRYGESWNWNDLLHYFWITLFFI